MTEKKEKNWFSNLSISNLNGFLIIILVSIAAIVYAYVETTKDYKSRQKIIVEAQNNQLSKLDSIMGSFYNESMKLSKDTAYYKILIDSMSKSKNNKQAYADSIVKSVISAAIRTQNNRELTDQLRKDSIFVHTQIGQIQNDTKNQLSLEFNKLQNEYFTLQLWGGILTIVFLIFTFYSLFKTDDLMKQGKDAVDEINKLKATGDRVIEQTNVKTKEAEEKHDKLLKKEQEDISTFVKKAEDTINLLTDDFERGNGVILKNQKEAFEKIVGDYQKQWQALLEDMTDYKQQNGVNDDSKLPTETPKVD